MFNRKTTDQSTPAQPSAVKSAATSFAGSVQNFWNNQVAQWTKVEVRQPRSNEEHRHTFIAPGSL